MIMMLIWVLWTILCVLRLSTTGNGIGPARVGGHCIMASYFLRSHWDQFAPNHWDSLSKWFGQFCVSNGFGQFVLPQWFLTSFCVPLFRGSFVPIHWDSLFGPMVRDVCPKALGQLFVPMRWVESFPCIGTVCPICWDKIVPMHGGIVNMQFPMHGDKPSQCIRTVCLNALG